MFVRKGSAYHQSLLALNNAGPGKIRQLRNEAAKRGLDPNVWFGNMEQVASERIADRRETLVQMTAGPGHGAVIAACTAIK